MHRALAAPSDKRGEARTWRIEPVFGNEFENLNAITVAMQIERQLGTPAQAEAIAHEPHPPHPPPPQLLPLLHELDEPQPEEPLEPQPDDSRCGVLKVLRIALRSDAGRAEMPKTAAKKSVSSGRLATE